LPEKASTVGRIRASDDALDCPSDLLEKYKVLDEQSEMQLSRPELSKESQSKLSKESQSKLLLRKIPWTEQEDNLVVRLVQKYGAQKWTFIAQHLPDRIGKQCRERWHNHLNPNINKKQWSADEQWILFLCHRLNGNK